MPGVLEVRPIEIPPAGGYVDRELEKLVKISNIPRPTMRTHRFGAWKHRGDEAWWTRVLEYSAGYYGHPFLTFLGTVGTGRTHIALSIAWEWLERHKTVLYYQVEGLLDALRCGFSSWQQGNPDGYQSIITFTQVASLLVLDDLGAQQVTDFSSSKLDEIIDYRYLNHLPLVVTTNLTLAKLPPRIADRLREGTLVQLSGTSYRKVKHDKREGVVTG